jgi:hypothetical protein
MQKTSLGGWRVAAIFFFAGIAILEFADTVNSMIGVLDFMTDSSIGNIAPGIGVAQFIGSIILTVAITLLGAATVYALYARQMWAIRTGTITGILLLVFGFFQVFNDSLFLDAEMTQIAFTGALYGMLGILSIWLVRRGAAEE